MRGDFFFLTTLSTPNFYNFVVETPPAVYSDVPVCCFWPAWETLVQATASRTKSDGAKPKELPPLEFAFCSQNLFVETLCSHMRLEF